MTTTFRLIFALPLLCCAVAATAIAHGDTQERDGSRREDRMDWRQDGQHLRLHGSAQGVQVEEANALRLRQGDMITALGSQPVRTPQSLIAGLKALQGHSVALQVRGSDGNARMVRWSPSEYAGLLPPTPPSPPLAPPPPPAPQP